MHDSQSAVTRRLSPWLLAATIAFATTGHGADAPFFGLDRTAGRVATYRGTSKVTQTQGKEVVSAQNLALSVTIAMLREPSDDGPGRAIVARSYSQGEQSEGLLVTYEWTKDGTLRRLSPEQQLDDVSRNLNIYFPFRWLPEAGSGERKATIRALGQIAAEGLFRFDVTGQSDTTYSQVLSAGSKIPFDFGGRPATVNAWSFTHVLGGEPRALRSMGHRTTAILGQGDGALTVQIDTQLELESIETPTGVAKYQLETSLEQLAELNAAYAARKPSAELTTVSEGIVERTKDSAYGAVGHAAASGLVAYRETFETAPDGALLAKLLGGKPPEFELENLEGKKVKLSEAIKGRVAYLNFWGVG